mmetsp:Transcript_5995/g.13900  ORF Transcript_5995/g.13900 Transcript_5995/m.13900 type:complete len:240 (+) Transcript_5995:271-990(+)
MSCTGAFRCARVLLDAALTCTFRRSCFRPVRGTRHFHDISMPLPCHVRDTSSAARGTRPGALPATRNCALRGHVRLSARRLRPVNAACAQARRCRRAFLTCGTSRTSARSRASRCTRPRSPSARTCGRSTSTQTATTTRAGKFPSTLILASLTTMICRARSSSQWSITRRGSPPPSRRSTRRSTGERPSSRSRTTCSPSAPRIGASESSCRSRSSATRRPASSTTTPSPSACCSSSRDL